MSSSDWPSFPEPPSVAFVDVDGTLLAHTTTFLFARILYRRGLIRRSFLLRALHHGLQHKFGRLDYGRLIEIGLSYIKSIPVIELERIAYENFAEHVKPYQEWSNTLCPRRAGHADRAGVLVAPAGHRAPGNLPGVCRPADHPRRDRARRLVGAGSGPPCYGEGKLFWVKAGGRRCQSSIERSPDSDNWSDHAPRQGQAVVVHPRGRPRSRESGLGHRPTVPAPRRKSASYISLRRRRGSETQSTFFLAEWLRDASSNEVGAFTRGSIGASVTLPGQ